MRMKMKIEDEDDDDDEAFFFRYFMIGMINMNKDDHNDNTRPVKAVFFFSFSLPST